jgi:hypothetical protein
VQCIAVQSSNVGMAQMAWLKGKHLEQVRNVQAPILYSCDTDPRVIYQPFWLAADAWPSLCLMVFQRRNIFNAEVSYTCNEATDDDDASIRSDTKKMRQR